MSRATVTTFGRGVSFVASGETGTQANEFEAAIKSVTSSTDVGAVFVYDTRNDSDSGAWRKKCAGLSWFDETLNTATRGGRREFPSVALIVADNAAGSETITIYDLDDVAAPMWLVFQMGGANESLRNFSGRAGENANSLFALNGRVMWGINDDLVSGGVCIADFANDAGRRHGTLAAYTEVGRVLSERNSAILPQRMVGGLIVNSTVNDVAATVLEGAEIGALGLPIPTVSVATANGISIILPSGTVNSSNTGVSYSKVAFDSKSRLWRVQPNSNSTWMSFDEKSVFFTTGFSAGQTVTQSTHASASSFTPNYLGDVTAIATTSGDNLTVGTDEALNHYLFNPHNIDDSAVAYVTSTYNTGYMLGDIRLALAVPYASSSHGYSNGNTIGDRSVKANNLTTVAASGQQVTAVPVATDAETFAFSNFSADNYLSRASDTDFDFGTGDFSIMFWVKTTNTATSENYVTRADSTPETGDFTVLKTGSNKLNFFIRDGNSWTLCAVSTSDIGSDWQQVVVARSGPLVSLYINGVREDSDTHSLTMTPSGGSEFRIGNRADSPSTPAADASLSLVRISATAPAPQQVKEIYEAEAPLFRAGAKCLLSQVSFNDVNDLAYDNSSDLLYVGTKSGDAGDSVSTFRGLERVDTKDGQDLGWDGASANLVAAAGGVVGYARTGGTGGLVLDIPPFDVRGDTNIADSKLPDDGKFHFSGVTTNATPTAIGQIPIAENESYTVIARVMGLRYNAANSSIRHFCEIKQQFTRRVDGDVVEETQISKLEEGDWASLDAELDYDTGADTVQVKVTGDGSPSPGPYRVVWNATVEVQRISDKQYER